MRLGRLSTNQRREGALIGRMVAPQRVVAEFPPLVHSGKINAGHSFVDIKR